MTVALLSEETLIIGVFQFETEGIMREFPHIISLSHSTCHSKESKSKVIGDPQSANCDYNHCYNEHGNINGWL